MTSDNLTLVSFFTRITIFLSTKIFRPTDDDEEDYAHGDDYEYEDTEWVLEKDTFEGFINLKTVKIEYTECKNITTGTFDNLNIEE